MKGVVSASTPGLLDAWLAVHERYGSLSLSQDMAPAIDLAENGFPVSHVLAQAIADDPSLGRFPTSRAIFTRDGRPLQAGEALYQKDLARTFQAIVAGGRDVFYGGDVGRALVKVHTRPGRADYPAGPGRLPGPVAGTDSHRVPGYTVYEAPPNSSGHVLLQELSLVEQFDLQSLGCNTAESIHLMVGSQEAGLRRPGGLRRRPPVRGRPNRRPGVQGVRPGAGRSSSTSTGRQPALRQGNPWSHQSGRRDVASAAITPGGRHHLLSVVVDRWGNAVCQLQSLQSGWGSSVVAGDTGILLNNRMTYWHLNPWPRGLPAAG